MSANPADMDNGIYYVIFRNGNKRGMGVIVVDDSRANGGDASFTYSGRIGRDNNSEVRGSLLIKQHAGQVGASVVRGLSDYRLDVKGKIENGHIQLTGSLPDHPGISTNILLFGHRIRGLEDSIAPKVD